MKGAACDRERSVERIFEWAFERRNASVLEDISQEYRRSASEEQASAVSLGMVEAVVFGSIRTNALNSARDQ